MQYFSSNLQIIQQDHSKSTYKRLHNYSHKQNKMKFIRVLPEIIFNLPHQNQCVPMQKAVICILLMLTLL